MVNQLVFTRKLTQLQAWFGRNGSVVHLQWSCGSTQRWKVRPSHWFDSHGFPESYYWIQCRRQSLAMIHHFGWLRYRKFARMSTLRCLVHWNWTAKHQRWGSGKSHWCYGIMGNTMLIRIRRKLTAQKILRKCEKASFWKIAKCKGFVRDEATILGSQERTFVFGNSMRHNCCLIRATDGIRSWSLFNKQTGAVGNLAEI